MTQPALVHRLLERSADRTPDALFVIEPDARRTYAQVDAGASRVANLLIGLGVRPGDRVALLAQNGVFYVESYYGIAKAGAISVPINTASDPAMLEHFLGDSGARVLVAGPRMKRLLRRAGAALAGLRVVISPETLELPGSACEHVAWDTAASGARPGLPVTPADVAAIVYTSGSTGRPRGATLTHGNITANVEAIARYLELSAADRALQILPFYYVYGKSVLNTHAAVGASVVVENRFQYPNLALDTLEAEQCTGLAGVPSTFAILLDRSNLSQRPLESLRYVTQAGGRMSPALTRRLMGAIGARIFVMYGATEASARLAYLSPEELPDAVGSIGRAIDGVTLSLLDDDGVECAPGEVGEVVASGPNIMSGYWNDPEETARVLDQRGYHTGDLARRDAQGRLWIVGRRRDMLKAGGHRISAAEIEDALAAHPAVHEVAVIGVEDEILGERVKAFVVARGGEALDELALAEFLSRRVPPYKIPREWAFVPALPKNDSGKVMKRELSEEPCRELAPRAQDG